MHSNARSAWQLDIVFQRQVPETGNGSGGCLYQGTCPVKSLFGRRGCKLLLHPGEEQFGCGREDLVFLPNDVKPRFQTRFQRPENQIAVRRYIQKFIKRDCKADPVFHQQCSVENQIERGHDIQFLVIVAEPLNAGCPDSGKAEKN